MTQWQWWQWWWLLVAKFGAQKDLNKTANVMICCASQTGALAEQHCVWNHCKNKDCWLNKLTFCILEWQVIYFGTCSQAMPWLVMRWNEMRWNETKWNEKLCDEKGCVNQWKLMKENDWPDHCPGMAWMAPTDCLVVVTEKHGQSWQLAGWMKISFTNESWNHHEFFGWWHVKFLCQKPKQPHKQKFNQNKNWLEGEWILKIKHCEQTNAKHQSYWKSMKLSWWNKWKKQVMTITSLKKEANWMNCMTEKCGVGRCFFSNVRCEECGFILLQWRLLFQWNSLKNGVHFQQPNCSTGVPGWSAERSVAIHQVSSESPNQKRNKFN